MIWILIGFLICMVAGCYVAYKEAKIHELHKMRAAFEDKKHSIENLMDTLEVKGQTKYLYEFQDNEWPGIRDEIINQ